ncbi:putative conjugal transfer protein TrbB [Thiomonas sp. X19]|uniref:P-type conjugative transfer ATPase TrbB n=1 Tax=Thiomonas sp. X19 TaxID=1050370 RepID=UPI000B6B15BD|nr:P-type conjugative transfer ATPase TrbB [Thiomonas sp. X19]SCC94655.1 putative conjugal transfer protein TrbB [Thiomonas sp. X19]
MSAHESTTKTRQIEALKRALGAQILDYLADPTVVEIMLNPDGTLWVDRLGAGMQKVGEVPAVQSLTIVNTVAAMLETTVTSENPILECELPLDGSRFEALIPPLVERASFALRKKALLVFTLDDYLQKGIMTRGQKQAIEEAVSGRQNILVSGGTGSGKTTAANAILDCMAQVDHDHRIVVIEDTRELQVNAQNVVFLRTSDNTDMTRLLRATMRLRPDRIVVGEVRDGSALALLKAWNTGHPGGVGTVHANDASAALIRIGQLIQEAGVPPNPELIAEAINVVVSIKRTATGRRVEEVAAVRGWSASGGFHVERLA